MPLLCIKPPSAAIGERSRNLPSPVLTLVQLTRMVTQPLYWAALNDHVQTARSLLAATQAASAEPVTEATAMDVAARNGGLKILDLLLRAGLDPTLSPFSFPDSHGRLYTNRDIEGKVVLLNLWATWCGPCRSEMPWFVEFQDRYRDRGFTVAAVSMDDDGWEAVRPFVAEFDLNFPGAAGRRRRRGLLRRS